MDDIFRYEDNLWKKTDSKEIVFNKIPENSFVLDLGCWTGRLGEKLIKEKKCRVFGVDINNEALKIAEKRLDKVFWVNLDDPEKIFKNINDKFDCIVLTDVIEHLKNPQKLLIIIKKSLKKNGRIYISVPNFAYWHIRLKILLGKFDYEKTGILDETHLRFFTKKSAEKLLDSCGYKILEFYYTGRQFFPEINGFQFVFICEIVNN